MRIIYHTSVIEQRMGGATLTTCLVLQWFAKRGHSVAILTEKSERTEVFGIKVHVTSAPNKVADFYRWADVVFAMRRSPLQPLREYNLWHRPHGAPPLVSVYFAHNVGQPYRYGYVDNDIDLCVFNAHWVKEASGWSSGSFVLHPTIFADDYKATPGDKITQINLAAKKGGEIFWDLVRRFPDRKFLAITGREPDQIIPSNLPSNVELMDYTPNIRGVYGKTRILLVPSQGYAGQNSWTGSAWTESYGRVAVEASVSGIPVVAFPTPGLMESMGDQAIYCDERIETWVKAIESLDDAETYAAASKASLAVAERLDPEGDLLNLEAGIEAMVEASRTSVPTYRAFFNATEELPPEALPHVATVGINVAKERAKRQLKDIRKAARRNPMLAMANSATPMLRWALRTAQGRLTSREKSLVLVMAPENGEFNDNAKYAYLRLKKEQDLNVIYMTYGRSTASSLKREGIDAETVGSATGRGLLTKAAVIVGTAIYPFQGSRGHLGSGAKKIQLWHGAGVKVFHRGRASYLQTRGDLKRRANDLWNRSVPKFDIVYFPSEMLRTVRKDWFAHKEALVNGFLRNDVLKGYDFGLGQHVGVDTDALQKAKMLQAAGKKVILFAPTFRKRNIQYLGKTVPFDLDMLDRKLSELGAALIFKQHPHMVETPQFSKFDNIYRCRKASDIYPLIPFTDVLLTDYSSIATDYALHSSSIIRYFPDEDEVIQSGKVVPEVLAQLPGLMVRTFPELLEALETVVASAPRAPEANVFHDHLAQWSGDRLVADIRRLLE